MIEMTLPSTLDQTVAPPGAHVAQMFVQFTPYVLAGGKKWDEHSKQAFANVGMFKIKTLYQTVWGPFSFTFLCSNKSDRFVHEVYSYDYSVSNVLWWN